MARRILAFIIAALAGPALSGCLAIGVATLATETAVSVTGDVLEGAVNVGGAVIKTAIPGDGEDDDEDDDSE